MTTATRGTEPIGRRHPDGPVTVSLIGSTGSIGTQAIDVVEACPERFDVVALGAHRSVDQLVAQADRLHPSVVAIGDPARAGELAGRLAPGVEVVVGTEGLAHIATLAQVAVNGVVGFAGLTGHLGRPRGRPPPGPGQQGVDHRRCAAGRSGHDVRQEPS